MNGWSVSGDQTTLHIHFRLVLLLLPQLVSDRREGKRDRLTVAI